MICMIDAGQQQLVKLQFFVVPFANTSLVLKLCGHICHVVFFWFEGAKRLLTLLLRGD